MLYGPLGDHWLVMYRPQCRNYLLQGSNLCHLVTMQLGLLASVNNRPASSQARGGAALLAQKQRSGAPPDIASPRAPARRAWPAVLAACLPAVDELPGIREGRASTPMVSGALYQ